MDAIVMGDDHPPSPHPGQSPIECWVVDIDFSPKRADEPGKQLVDGITGQAWLDRRLAAKHAGLRPAERTEGHDRTVQPQNQLEGDLVQSLQIPYQLKVVTRSAAGILQGKDLMVIEDAHGSLNLRKMTLLQFRSSERQSGPSETAARTLQDSACLLAGKEKEVIYIFPDLTVSSHLMALGFKLLDGYKLLSIQKIACIADVT